MDPGSDLLGWEQPNAAPAAAAANKPKKKRRSSILKVPTNNIGNHREPLQDLNTNSGPITVENSAAVTKAAAKFSDLAKKRRSSKRVSFSASKLVKEFQAGSQTLTIWNNTYEEEQSHCSSSTGHGSSHHSSSTTVNSSSNDENRPPENLTLKRPSSSIPGEFEVSPSKKAPLSIDIPVKKTVQTANSEDEESNPFLASFSTEEVDLLQVPSEVNKKKVDALGFLQSLGGMTARDEEQITEVNTSINRGVVSKDAHLAREGDKTIMFQDENGMETTRAAGLDITLGHGMEMTMFGDNSTSMMEMTRCPSETTPVGPLSNKTMIFNKTGTDLMDETCALGRLGQKSASLDESELDGQPKMSTTDFLRALSKDENESLSEEPVLPPNSDFLQTLMGSKVEAEHGHEKTLHEEKVTTTTEVTDVTTSSTDNHKTVHTVTTTKTATEKTVIYDADESMGGMEMTECIKISKTKDAAEETLMGHNTALPTPEVTRCDSQCLMTHEGDTTESHKHISVQERDNRATVVNPANVGMEVTECLPVANPSSQQYASPSPVTPVSHQNQTVYQPENGGMEMTECLPSLKSAAPIPTSPLPATPVVGVNNQTLNQPADGGMDMTGCLTQRIEVCPTPTLEKTSLGMEMTECVPRLAEKVAESAAKSPVTARSESNKTLLNPDNGGMEMTECVTAALKRSIAPQNTGGIEEEDRIESANSSLYEATATMPFNKLVRANNTLMLQRSSNKSRDGDVDDNEEDDEEVVEEGQEDVVQNPKSVSDEVGEEVEFKQPSPEPSPITARNPHPTLMAEDEDLTSFVPCIESTRKVDLRALQLLVNSERQETENTQSKREKHHLTTVREEKTLERSVLGTTTSITAKSMMEEWEKEEQERSVRKSEEEKQQEPSSSRNHSVAEPSILTFSPVGTSQLSDDVCLPETKENRRESPHVEQIQKSVEVKVPAFVQETAEEHVESPPKRSKVVPIEPGVEVVAAVEDVPEGSVAEEEEDEPENVVEPTRMSVFDHFWRKESSTDRLLDREHGIFEMMSSAQNLDTGSTVVFSFIKDTIHLKLGLGYSLPSSETEENGDKFIIQHWTVTTVTVEATGKEKTAHLRLTNSLLVRHLSFAKLSDLCPSTLHLGKLLDFVSANVNESVRLHLDLRKVQGSHFYFEIKQGHKIEVGFVSSLKKMLEFVLTVNLSKDFANAKENDIKSAISVRQIIGNVDELLILHLTKAAQSAVRKGRCQNPSWKFAKIFLDSVDNFVDN